jgi:hypothetical protein
LGSIRDLNLYSSSSFFDFFNSAISFCIWVSRCIIV